MRKEITLRLPDDLDEALKEKAEESGLPIHSLIVVVLLMSWKMI